MLRWVCVLLRIKKYRNSRSTECWRWQNRICQSVHASGKTTPLPASVLGCSLSINTKRNTSRTVPETTRLARPTYCFELHIRGAEMIQYIFSRGERFYLKELQIDYYRVLSACALFTTTIRFHWNLEDTLQLILG